MNSKWAESLSEEPHQVSKIEFVIVITSLSSSSQQICIMGWASTQIGSILMSGFSADEASAYIWSKPSWHLQALSKHQHEVTVYVSQWWNSWGQVWVDDIKMEGEGEMEIEGEVPAGPVKQLRKAS